MMSPPMHSIHGATCVKYSRQPPCVGHWLLQRNSYIYTETQVAFFNLKSVHSKNAEFSFQYKPLNNASGLRARVWLEAIIRLLLDLFKSPSEKVMSERYVDTSVATSKSERGCSFELPLFAHHHSSSILELAEFISAYYPKRILLT